ncbi:MAG: hypothetical protein LAP40_25130 [Acidobacteriia bacterium]|nr:hypothetical protein [Terriglobia bacterium]
MKPSLCLLPLMLAAPAFCADAALVDLLPPDTQIVIGARVRAVVESDLARTLTPEIQQVPQAQGLQVNWETIVAMAGFDPLHDIEEVIVATNGQGPKAPTLVVARGKFPVEKLSAGGESYHGVPLMSVKTQADGVFAFLDGNVALAGDAGAVKAAIDRRGSASGLPSALGAKIADYQARYEIWGIVNRTEALAGYLPSQSKQAGPFDSIDRLQFGVGLKDGLAVFAEAHARSLKDADQLASTLQFFEAMTRAQQPAAAAGAKFDVKSSKGTIQVSLAVSAEGLKKAIEMQRKSGTLRAMGGTPAVSGPARVPVAEPRASSASSASSPASGSVTVPTTGATTSGGTAVFTLPSHR